MTDAITIVRAAPGDAQTVSSILTEAADWLAGRGTPMWRRNELTVDEIAPAIDRDEFYLAYRDGDAVGTFLLQWDDWFFWPDATPGESAFIHRLAVKRSAAGSGVSKAMVEWARDRAASEGRAYLRLDCAANRPRLRATYESLGFVFHSELIVGLDIGREFECARYQMDLRRGNEARRQ